MFIFGLLSVYLFLLILYVFKNVTWFKLQLTKYCKKVRNIFLLKKKMKPYLSKKCISKNAKIRYYSTVVKPECLYESECLDVYKRQPRSLINLIHMSILYDVIHTLLNRANQYRFDIFHPLCVLRRVTSLHTVSNCSAKCHATFLHKYKLKMWYYLYFGFTL